MSEKSLYNTGTGQASSAAAMSSQPNSTTGHFYPDYAMPGPPASPAMRGKARMIATSFAIVALPMLAFSVTLISLIAAYAEPDSWATIRREGAVYINLSATTFTTVASWASTIAPLLVSSMLLLASYPAAFRMLAALHKGQLSALPTPFQLALLLEIRIGGTFRDAIRWLRYVSDRKTAKAAPPTRVLARTLLLGFFMRYVRHAQQKDTRVRMSF